MKKCISFLLVLIALASCNIDRRTAEEDTVINVEDLEYRSEGISCEEVYMEMEGGERIEIAELSYGQEFSLFFKNVEGLLEQDGYTKPEMELVILAAKNDTVMYEPNLFKDLDGTDLQPLLIHADIRAADPMKSGERYTLIVVVTDELSEGKMTSTMEFTIHSNDRIKVEKNGTEVEEVFLFSQDSEQCIAENELVDGENFTVNSIKLEGFTEVDGKVLAGVSLKAETASGKVVLDERDIVGNNELELAELIPQMYFTKGGEKGVSPIHCWVKIWDKRSMNSINYEFEVTIK